jgi:hypothetical protein
MGKVFRLYKGNNNIEDWGNSVPYGSKAIGEIVDPLNASKDREITSIPSPFARIDLVKNAYREVVRSGKLHGNSIHHKMVSDSLDIAQIFFNLPKLTDKVKVVVWNVKTELNALLQSPSSAHQRVAKTLQMYLSQDCASYNFDKLQSVYLLHYYGKKRKTSLDIIGATSPSTLFFSSANDLSYLSDDICFGKDRVFDDQFTSLDQRDDNFIVFYYAYRKAYPCFALLFPEVNEYMDLVYRALTPAQKDLVDTLSEHSAEDYPELLVNPNKVEIIGTPYRHCLMNVAVKSGFEIQSTLPQSGKVPLVLPIEPGTIYTDIFYVSDNWESESYAPIYDSNPIEERHLPMSNEVYPYLSIGDFLEDSLIQVKVADVEDKTNGSAFYGKFYPKDSCNRYLLPLKDTFFKYFTVDDLQEKVNGNLMFELRELAGGDVLATLRIPIQNKRSIEYTRRYSMNNADLKHNRGELLVKDFTVGLYSNIKYIDESQAYYRAYLIGDFDEVNSDYDLLFCKDALSFSVGEAVIRNEEDSNYNYSKAYIIENKTFDYMRVKCGDESGVLIPLFQRKGGSDQFTFAVDFGTTNSHIEYTVNNGNSIALDISEPVLKLWGAMDKVSTYVLDYDVLPASIGKDSLYRFPMRTALCESVNTNWNRAVFALANANIPFPYEKKRGYKYDRVQTNLKWSNDNDNIKRIRTYIESLFMLLRAKVLLNNGNLAQTKIVWFYPISMVENRYNLFKDEWVKAYVKYFGGDKNNVMPMTESVAPYEHYRNSESNVSNIVTIDIGGGTSDIVIADNGNVKQITSFHFAADSIFGEPYVATHSVAMVNRLLLQYERQIKNVLDVNSLTDLSTILNQHMEAKNSANIASFFFSLKENLEIKSRRLSENVDFNDMLLRDSDYKIVFVIFYTAIVYHLARIMKSSGMQMPRHIAFSGNGSKVVRILTSSNKTLEKFTKVIFEKVYEQSYPEDGLTILQNEDNPKEVTCKGGLSNPLKQEYDEVASMKIVYKSTKCEGESCFVRKETYACVDDNYIREVVDGVKKFVRFTLDLNEDFSFKKNFDASVASLEIAERECLRDLVTYTKNGLENKRKEVSNSDVIEETLFFYPLNGMLNALTTAIYQQKNSNKNN